MVRSWPKNKFFTPMPNNMTLNRVKLPSIYAHEQVSNSFPLFNVLVLKQMALQRVSRDN